MAIDNKLKTAAQTRDENIKKMLDRLKEHVRTIWMLTNSNFRLLVWLAHKKK